MVAEWVAGLQPDVILMNAPQAWHVALTGIARGGCWRLGTDILDEHHAGLSLLRPVLAGSNVSTIDLRLADDSELDMPLSASTGTTHPGSFQLQRDGAFAKLPAFLFRGPRSAVRRVGKDCVTTLRSRWSPTH